MSNGAQEVRLAIFKVTVHIRSKGANLCQHRDKPFFVLQVVPIGGVIRQGMLASVELGVAVDLDRGKDWI